MTTYIIGISGFVLLFFFSGLTIDCGTSDSDMINQCVAQSPNSIFLSLLLAPENFPDTNLGYGLSILGALGLIATIGITAGIFRGDLVTISVAALSVFLLTTMWDVVIVFNVMRAVNPVLSTLIVSPIMFLLGITVVEWWGRL